MEPKIAFACPECPKSYSVPASKAGQRTRCPACGAAMTVPRLDEPPIINAPDLEERSPKKQTEPELGPRDRLKPCPECGQNVSTRAPSCPHCGCPLKKAPAQQSTSRPVKPRGLLHAFFSPSQRRPAKPKQQTGCFTGCLSIVCGFIFLLFLSSLFRSCGKAEEDILPEVAAPVAPQKKEWVLCQPNGTNFTAKFPAEPRVLQNGQMTLATLQVGDIKLNAYQKKLKADVGEDANLAYAVLCESNRREMQGTILSEQTININGYLGREFVIEGYLPQGATGNEDKKSILRTRSVIKGDQHYDFSISYNSPPLQPFKVNEIADQFLDSCTIYGLAPELHPKKQEWVFCRPDGANFAVKFPGEPTVVQAGQTTVTNYRQGAMQYTAFQKTLAEDVGELRNVAYDAVREANIRELKATLLSETDIQLSGIPGREFVFDGYLTLGKTENEERKSIIQMRCVIKGTQEYVFFVSYTPPVDVKKANELVKEFLDFFTIID